MVLVVMYYSGILGAWWLAGVCRAHCARGDEGGGLNPVGTVVCGGYIYTGGGRTYTREVQRGGWIWEENRWERLPTLYVLHGDGWGRRARWVHLTKLGQE